MKGQIMKVVMLNKRRIVFVTILSFICYFLLRKKEYILEVETVIKNVKPQVVWEFSADFSNIKKYLIPEIEDFTIFEESGNFDHWEYSVKFSEAIPVWPPLYSINTGKYIVFTNNNKYIISTTQTGCYYGESLCSKSITEFKMSAFNKQDTLYKEKIIYECIPLLKYWCHSVSNFTRISYINNLKAYFNNNNNEY